MTARREVPVQTTPLPGVGLRLDFTTGSGRRIGVIHRQEGGLELFVGEATDPDLAAVSASLSSAEAATLAELLGGSTFSHEISHLQHAAAAVAVDWLPVEDGTRFVGRTLGDSQLRTRTGVSVVAVIRDAAAIPSPAPEFVFAAGDVLVAVGTSEGLAAAGDIVRSRA